MLEQSLATRRRVLASTLAASGSAWLHACAEFRDTPVRMPGSPAADLPFVDAHCHIFNARDIPVYEFACHVAVDIDERRERGLLRGIVERVTDVLVAAAPTVRDEEE
jgi:hypothetical protein